MTPIQAFLTENQLMSAEDLRDLLGWSDETLKAKMARREAPPFIRVKRLVLFPWGELRAWMEANGEVITPAGAKPEIASDLLGVGR